MSDNTNARIDALEERIAALQDELATTRRDLTDAQLDQWKGRIDELEVQLHLGRREAQEQMAPVVEQLRSGWLDARSQLTGATTKASDVFATLREGVEQAMEDLRDAVRDARER